MKDWTLTIIGASLITIGAVLMIYANSLWMAKIIAVLGLELIIWDVIRMSVIKRRTLQSLGYVVILFSLFNFSKHRYVFTTAFWKNASNSADLVNLKILIPNLLWVLLSFWILWQAVRLLTRIKSTSFESFLSSKRFYVLMVAIALLLILEIPFFPGNPALGGISGCSFWDW